MNKNFVVIAAVAIVLVVGIFVGVYALSGGFSDAAQSGSGEISGTQNSSLDSDPANNSAEKTDLPTVDSLKSEDITVGDGEEAVAGKTVSVLYRGALTDGTVFDSAEDPSSPFEFVLGAGEVIEGWDVGVEGMKVGGVRKLQIPGDMAYGEAGVQGIIPADATLVFEVTLLGVQ